MSDPWIVESEERIAILTRAVLELNLRVYELEHPGCGLYCQRKHGLRCLRHQEFEPKCEYCQLAKKGARE